MFENRLTLFRMFGFSVRLDLSWLLIALLVTWSLAEGFFPDRYPDLSNSVYWLMGILGAAGLFLSIIFHEFCHSLVARRYGLPMKGITLFVFGGIAEMEDEPQNPKTEFLMALAGPVSTLLLALLLYLLWSWGKQLGWGDLVNGITGYLAFINLLLAVFNLLPAFPLDGGRLLRSTLWRWQGDLRRATRTATRIGSGFGIVLMLFGVLNAFGGNLLGGMWYFLIGLFIRGAAKNSYRRLLLQEAFTGKRVDSLMHSASDTIAPDTSLAEVVAEHLPRQKGKVLPVVEQGRLAGCITLAQIRNVPREERRDRSAGELLQACPREAVIDRGTDVMEALAHMNRTGTSRLLVVDGQQLVGSLSRADITDTFSAWMELEDAS